MTKTKVVLVFILIITLVILILGYRTFTLLEGLDHLPTGDLIKEVPSPTGEYTFKAYLVNGGATVDFAVRGEIIYNKERRKSQTIYWNYHEDRAEVKWLDNQTISINGHTLNVLKDKYDWRKQ